MKKLTAIIAAILILCVGANACAMGELIEAPETEEQRILVDISERHANQIIENLLMTSEMMLDNDKDIGYVSEEVYDFVHGMEDGMEAPISINILVPTEKFGESEWLAETANDPDADTESLWPMFGLGLMYLTNYNANLEWKQAMFLEQTSHYAAEKAWPGSGVAYVVRYYGPGRPQIVTALLLSGDSDIAVAKTSIVYFRQIADFPGQLLGQTYVCFGDEAFEYAAIKRELSLEETMVQVFANCTGYEGTAGSSLKEVIAAEYIASAALECAMADADGGELARAVSTAWDRLAAEQKAEFRFNLEGIARLLEDTRSDFAALEDLFETAGMLEYMRALTGDENWYRHWTALLDVLRENISRE